jgi:hypothetical protein
LLTKSTKIDFAKGADHLWRQQQRQSNDMDNYGGNMKPIENPVIVDLDKVRQSLDIDISNAYQTKSSLKIDKLKMPVLNRSR